MKGFGEMGDMEMQKTRERHQNIFDRKELHILARGVVDKYSEDKGFGFIKEDNGNEVIVDRGSIDIPGYKTLVPGEHVVFEIEDTFKGPKAKNVKKVMAGR